MKLQKLPNLFAQTFQEWRRNKPVMTAAGLSYFVLLSLIPMIVLVLKVAGVVFEAVTVKSKFLEEIRNWFNPDIAMSIQNLLAPAEKASVKATTFSVLFLLWASMRMFMELQDSLNSMWGVTHSAGFGKWLVHRFRAFAMIVVLSLVLLVFLSIDLAFAFVKKALLLVFPAVLIKGIIPVVSFVLAFALFTVLFAMIFKFLPEKRIPWRNVWEGAMVSSLLFALARVLITFYFLHSPIKSLYGAAGSIIILLIWIYFSIQTFLFGAQFTHVYAEQRKAEQLPAL